MYSTKFLELFNQASNYGFLRGADANGIFTDEQTGEVAKISLKIQDETIVDAKYKVFGAIKTTVLAEKFVEIIKGLSLNDARQILPSKLGEYFQEFNLDTEHSQNLLVNALNSAIDDYEETLRKQKIKQLKAQGKEIPESLKKPKK